MSYFMPRTCISGVDEAHKGNAAMEFQRGGDISAEGRKWHHMLSRHFNLSFGKPELLLA